MAAGRVPTETWSLDFGGMMKKFMAPLGVAALLLTGCSGGATDEPTASSTPKTSATTEPTEAAIDAMGPGTYMFDTGTGTTGTIEIPGAAPADLEDLRTQAGGEPVTYLAVNVDNRDGAESFDVYTVTIYDNDGTAYEFQSASDYVDSITPDSSVVGADVYNLYVEAYNSYSSVVDAMERTDVVVVGSEVPADIAGVSVSSGFEDFGATPAG